MNARVRSFFALPEPLWELVRATAGAFAVLVALGYAAARFRPDSVELLLGMLESATEGMEAQELDPAVMMAALFVNNVFALLTVVAIGFVPFLRLPALELGLNGLLLGGMAAHYRRKGIGLAAYLAGTLPHGVVELPALVLACACGLYLCRAVTDRLLHREAAPPVRGVARDALRVYVCRVVPLLFLSAFIEAYITPSLMARFL